MASTDSMTLGKYRLIEKLGQGTFGIVYRGVDTVLNRPVAIKVLKAGLVDSVEWIERFQREALLASQLRHPNIVNILDAGVEESRHYLVMDYLPGRPLSELFKDQAPFSLKKTVAILEPLAAALDYAHSKGLIHRDIKPSNILIIEGDCPILTDFGLVKSLEEPGSTTTGVMLGTADYMAPEQILGKEVTRATDLYALGVIAFSMLTGQLPFSGVTPFEVQMGHVSKTPPAPRSLRPELPVEVDAILLKALSKEPAQRYPDGKTLVAEIKKVAGKADQQIVRALVDSAAQKAAALDFTGAISAMQQALSIADSADLDGALKEYTRRKERYEEYLRLRQQIEESQKIIDRAWSAQTELLRTEAWIMAPAKPEPPVRVQKNIPVKQNPAASFRLKPLADDPSYAELMNEDKKQAGSSKNLIYGFGLFISLGLLIGFTFSGGEVVGSVGIILTIIFGALLFRNVNAN
jgi:serine/threonine protein kinase